MSKQPPKFRCRSEAQKRAIRRSYAKKAVYKEPMVSVRIKDHRDKNDGHPHVIVEDFEDKHVSVGITHDKYKGKGHSNYPLDVNPLGKPDDSYMRKQGTVDSKSAYYRPRTGVMTEKDYSRAKEYGKRAKTKYLDKRNKKK